MTLERVQECYEARRHVDELLREAVLEAIKQGYSPPAIAAAAGISRQAAHSLVKRLQARSHSAVS